MDVALLRTLALDERVGVDVDEERTAVVCEREVDVLPPLCIVVLILFLAVVPSVDRIIVAVERLAFALPKVRFLEVGEVPLTDEALRRVEA